VSIEWRTTLCLECPEWYPFFREIPLYALSQSFIAQVGPSVLNLHCCLDVNAHEDSLANGVILNSSLNFPESNRQSSWKFVRYSSFHLSNILQRISIFYCLNLQHTEQPSDARHHPVLSKKPVASSNEPLILHLRYFFAWMWFFADAVAVEVWFNHSR
jgi:hypothetical protein